MFLKLQTSMAADGPDLFVEVPQLSVLPQRVHHLRRRLHNLHRVPATSTHR